MQMADCSNYRLKTIDRNFSKAGKKNVKCEVEIIFRGDEAEVNRKFQEALLEAELDESPPSVTTVLRQLDVKEFLPEGFQDALLPVRQLDVKESCKLLSESNQDALPPVTQVSLSRQLDVKECLPDGFQDALLPVRQLDVKESRKLLSESNQDALPPVTQVLRQLDVKECLPDGFQDALLPVRQLDVKESRKLLSESNQDALPPVTQVLRQLDVKECLPDGFQDALLPVRQLDVKESRKLLSESNQDALPPVTQDIGLCVRSALEDVDELHENFEQPVSSLIRGSPEEIQFIDQPTAKGTKKQNKRRKKHCCKYCSRLIENFPRHLRTQHSSEDEVKALLALPLSQEFRERRRQIIYKIKMEGDSSYNSQNPTTQIMGEGGEYKAPSAPHQYGPRMKDVATYLLTELIDSKKSCDRKQLNTVLEEIAAVEEWLKLFSLSFDKQIASLGRKQAERRTFESRNALPSMEDVQRLIVNIEKVTEKAFRQLQRQGFSALSYKRLRLRYLNLNDEDLRLMSEAMGHTEKTHLLHYRKDDPALHAGRASKILIALDDGTIDSLKGKSLDQITNEVIPDDGNEGADNVDIDIEEASTWPSASKAVPSTSSHHTVHVSETSSSEDETTSYYSDPSPVKSRKRTALRKIPLKAPSRREVQQMMKDNELLEGQSLANTMGWVYAEIQRRKKSHKPN
ncbi:hypothetical protein GE061_009643 [Apolygus lucorum]|uniref:Uncharacterized protein n=1 Tax=Apolygus lucorum TaxID=248454 RepID=A0A8S9Y2U1_APOLU|nr:hypothetical protein GE061_009643 [Apolygus lucorum]